MSASLRAAGNTTTSAATLNLVADVPAGTVDGDVMIGILWFNDNTAVLTAGAGWTLVPNSRVNHSAIVLGVALYYKVASSEGPTETIATSNNNQQYTGMILTYRSDAATVPVEAMASLENALVGANITCPAISTQFVNEPLILTVGNLQNCDFSGPSGFTERQDATGPTNTLSSAVYTGTGLTIGSQDAQTVVATVAGAALGLQLSIAPSRVLTEQVVPLTLMDIQVLSLAIVG